MHTRSLIDCQNGNVPIFILIRIFKYSSISMSDTRDYFGYSLFEWIKKQNELNGNESIPGAL